MSVSGALFDMVKLCDVSKNVISTMKAEKVFELSYEWAKSYCPHLAALYEQDKGRATAILNIDRENKNLGRILQNGAIFPIISAICMMNPLPHAMN